MDWYTAGLGNIPLLTGAQTRSISAENPDGSVAGGARAIPGPNDAGSLLGQGGKVRPCITLEAGAVTTLADITGPGVISHIWITARTEAYRSCVLRIYWDGEETPSVEAPLGDFFGNCHGVRYNIASLPIAVNPSGGFNSYWPMPFRRHARITIENGYWDPIKGFFYQIDYALQPVTEQAAYLHAQWRRTTTSREAWDYVIVDGIRGQGHYVGTVVGWNQYSNGWWGEGEVKFYLDGDTQFPTICSTGTEDYFGGAWGFGGETYSTAFLGYPFYEKEDGRIPRHGLYRWHIMDPIRFQCDLRVTMQALGWWLNHKFEPLADDICSVAYWYQAEPHAPFPAMPDLAGRWPR